MFINGQGTVATSRDLCNSFFTICCDHTFILCYYCYMLSGIVLEIACPETLQRSGCFDSHMYIIYLFSSLCSFTSLHWAPIRSYFVEEEDKVTLWEDVALSLVSTKRRQWKHVVTLSCHSDFFATFEQVSDHYNSYFVCYHWL